MKKLRDIWELYEKIGSERKKKYGHPDNERVVLTIDGKRYVVDGYAGDMKKDGDHFYLTPVGGGRVVDYPTNMQGQVDKVDVIKQSEVGEAAKKPAAAEILKQGAGKPSLEEMAKEAARWKGAALKVAQEIGDDKKAALNHSKMTIKADLDAYLQRKFGIGAVEAREVSNHLTDKNIPADMSASLEDFKDEPWYTNRPKPAETKETYENRKLGYQHARTSADDEYSTEAMAAIALSNMKTGERFPVGRTWYTVSNITDKMLTVTGEDGEKKTFKPSGSKWEALVRDVGGAILGSHHGVDAGDLVTAFMRDPAARREGGMLSIKDTVPPLKKSVVDLFREGLAKAFGTR